MDWIPVVSSAVVALVAVLGLVYTHLKELEELKQRLAQVETKIEPFWQFVNKQIPEILTRGAGNPERLSKRDELLLKFKDGTILPHEKDELVSILEAERAQASKEKNIGLLIALGLLIAAATSKR